MQVSWLNRKWLVAPAAAVTAALLAVGVSSAHVTVWPRESTVNASELYTVRVPTEKPVNTVAVRVEFASNVTVSRFVPAPGWQRAVQKDAAGRITSATWSGGQIAPDEVGLFSFQARNPAGATEVAFKAIQTYADGSVVEWTGTPSEQYPASVVKLTDAPMSPAAVTTAAQVAQVVVAVNLLDNSGLHALDEGVATGEVPAGSLGRVQKAYLVTAATQWPAALKENATKLRTELGHLKAALEMGDVAAAAGPAHEVHELAHDLSSSAYAWLAIVAGVPAGEAAH